MRLHGVHCIPAADTFAGLRHFHDIVLVPQLILIVGGKGVRVSLKSRSIAFLMAVASLLVAACRSSARTVTPLALAG